MVIRGRTKLTRKGQMTVPAEVRKALCLKEGDELIVTYDEATGRAIVETPMNVVERTAGIFKRPGMPTLSDEELKQAVHDAAQQQAIERDERSKRG